MKAVQTRRPPDGMMLCHVSRNKQTPPRQGVSALSSWSLLDVCRPPYVKLLTDQARPSLAVKGFMLAADLMAEFGSVGRCGVEMSGNVSGLSMSCFHYEVKLPERSISKDASLSLFRRLFPLHKVVVLCGLRRVSWTKVFHYKFDYSTS